MSNPQPGFYDDGSGRRRWWDGAQWTDRYDAEAPAVYVSSGERSRIVMLFIGLMLLLSGGIYAIINWNDAQQSEEIATAISGGEAHADYTNFWIAVAVAAVGAVLVFTVWVIKSSRK
jgi:hypothetical protein